MTGVAVDERLLRALAEQLKLSILQIARVSELLQIKNDTAASQGLPDINNIAVGALRFLDSFLLSADMQDQLSLLLEPVSLSSTIQDVAHQLYKLAKDNDCQIRVAIKGKYLPVMAHKESLESVLYLIGSSFISNTPVSSKEKTLIFSAHKSSNGLTAGVFGNDLELNSDILRRGKALYGSAKQTMPKFLQSNGANIFVADSLLRGMSTQLRVAKHDKMMGLAATFLPSKQLSLV